MMVPVHASITGVEMYRQNIDEWEQKEGCRQKWHACCYVGLPCDFHFIPTYRFNKLIRIFERKIHE